MEGSTSAYLKRTEVTHGVDAYKTGFVILLSEIFLNEKHSQNIPP
jgi:hypothetical protein